MEMREQDLRLLKQLIDIGETIQRLTRSRRMEESSHPAVFPLVHPDVDLKQLTESLCTLTPKRRFADLLGDRPDTSVPLLRRQSEPHLCRLDHLDVLTSSSRQGSSSSIGSCSVDVLGSSDDALNTDTSENELDFSRSSITTIPDLTCSQPTPPPEDTYPDTGALFQRPKSHSVMALTYLRPAFVGSHSAYSDILNRNVRLWKGRLAQTRECHPEVASSLEEES
ncbi:uncharacterized protein LOC112566726 isoform X2 [Pomacea canaliculata]|nr:uncharacterized protein LOC112566726 isoform X2 [Pomacea canaliculata]